jgi:hypothetical protein
VSADLGQVIVLINRAPKYTKDIVDRDRNSLRKPLRLISTGWRPFRKNVFLLDSIILHPEVYFDYKWKTYDRLEAGYNTTDAKEDQEQIDIQLENEVITKFEGEVGIDIPSDHAKQRIKRSLETRVKHLVKTGKKPSSPRKRRVRYRQYRPIVGPTLPRNDISTPLSLKLISIFS